MTAAEVARLLGAKRTGRGRWIARCPAHADRNPSLGIREGHSWVLVRCWSQGCSTEAICAAAGLRVSDLAHNAPLSDRKAIREAEARRERLEAAERQEMARQRRLVGRARRWSAVCGRLGAMLAKQPRDAILGELFHRTLGTSRQHQDVIMPFFPHADPAGFDPCEGGVLDGCTAKEFGPQIAGYLRLPKE